MKHDLESLKNIGPKVANGLLEIGITTPEQLNDMGYMEAFLRLRMISPHWNNKMLLYALYGALNDTNCMYLPDEIKDRLNKELEDEESKS